MSEYPFIGNALCALYGGQLTLPAFARLAIARRGDARTIFIGAHENDPCLVGYDRSFAAALAADCRRRRAAIETSAPNAHHARERRIFGFVESVDFDETGRIALPPMLARRARIGATALIVGAGDSFEIWNPELALEASDPGLRELAALCLEFHDAA